MVAVVALRPTALVLVGVILAGCSGQPPPDTVARDGAVVVQPWNAEHVGFTYTGSHDVTLSISVSVLNNVPIDVFVVDDANLRAMKEGRSYFAKEGCTDEHTTRSTGACLIGPGTYHLVLDNTDLGAAKPVSTTCCEAQVDWSYQIQDP